MPKFNRNPRRYVPSQDSYWAGQSSRYTRLKRVPVRQNRLRRRFTDSYVQRGGPGSALGRVFRPRLVRRGFNIRRPFKYE